jgi:hypothetical protein
MSVPGVPFPPVLRPLTAAGPLELGTVDPIEWVSRASAYFHAQALGAVRSEEVNDQVAIPDSSAPRRAAAGNVGARVGCGDCIRWTWNQRVEGDDAPLESGD